MFSKEMIYLINEIKKEDSNFSLTEEDLRETLAYKKCMKEMLKETKLDRTDYHGLIEDIG